MSGKILSQNSSVGIGIVTADNDHSGNAVLLADIRYNSKLLFGFELCSAGADNVKTTGVSVLIDVRIIKNQIVVFQQTAGTAFEAVQLIFLAACFQGIVQSADNIVTAGSLSAGQDNADYLLLDRRSVLALLEGDLVLAVCVGEESLDLILICNTFGCIAIFYANLGDTVSEHARQLGVILISRDLKRG